MQRTLCTRAAHPLDVCSALGARLGQPGMRDLLAKYPTLSALRKAGRTAALPGLKAFYDRKRAEGKRHSAAVICLARRRCNVILAMLATVTQFQAGHGQPEPVTVAA